MKFEKKSYSETCYEYRGAYIYKITRLDYCAYADGKMVVHEKTLKAAKAKIDELLKEEA